MTFATPIDTEVVDTISMATSQALKAAKKELRNLLKPKLADIPKATIDFQSKSYWKLLLILQGLIRAIGKTAFQSLINLQQYQEARKISVYLSMPKGEIQTDEIVRHALGEGKKVFVPYLHKNPFTREEIVSGSTMPSRVMDMVSLDGLEDYESLARDAWGIPTVTEERLERRERVLGGAFSGLDNTHRLDLLLTPGVAFELQREQASVSRLGHGKGFYDYFLHRYRNVYEQGNYENSEVKIAIYGLALKEQVLQGDGTLHVPMGPQDNALDGLIAGDGQVFQSCQ